MRLRLKENTEPERSISGGYNAAYGGHKPAKMQSVATAYWHRQRENAHLYCALQSDLICDDMKQKQKGGDTMRKNLQAFRILKGLTQEQAADKIGFSRSTYNAVEKGRQKGGARFWITLQAAFDLRGSELEGLKQDEQN